MKKEDVYIPDQSYSSDEIHHGGKWSEEAKQRYREARRAGRSVYDMFGNLYNKANRQVTSKANNIANRTIYKKPIAKAKRDYKIAVKRRATIKKNYDRMDSVGSEFVNKGKTPQEKSRRAGLVAKNKSTTRTIYNNSNKRVASKRNAIRKASNHTLGEIAKDATKAVGKEIGKSANKATKAVGKEIGKSANKVKKATKDSLRKADKAITSAVNKHVANKDRKHIDKEEKKYIDKRRKSALNVAAKRKKYINKKYEEDVNKANREANVESVKNAFNLINRKEKEKKIYEKRKKALKKAKSQANNYWSEATKDVRKSIKDAEERTVDKYKYSSVKDITDKNVRSLKKKVGKTLNDINTNKGKGYKLTGKSKVTPKGGYERYASDAERGDVYGKRKVSVTTEGTRANSITDALTGKTNAYKEHSTKTEYKMWKEPKKKSKPKSKRKNKLRQSALNDVYIPGRIGVSETILHSDTFSGDDILKHYGIPGMKWGVRRARGMIRGEKSNYLYWKGLADDTNRNRSLANINEKTHKRLHKDIRKIIDNEAMELNGKGIDKKSGDLFVRSQISQAYKNISQLGYKIKSYDDLKRAVLEDTDVYQSDLISTAYKYNSYAHSKN